MSDKTELDRREFLLRLLTLPAAGVALSLSGCGAPGNTPAPAPTSPAAAPTRAPAPATSAPSAPTVAAASPTAAATAGSAPVAAAAATTAPTPIAAAVPTTAATQPANIGGAYLAVVRGKDPGAAELTRRAIAAVGGIERFVKKGADVIVKPNICNAYHGPEYASTTNPEVVAAIVALCLGAGAKRVRVMDFPFGGTAQNAYEQSGIAAGRRGGRRPDGAHERPQVQGCGDPQCAGAEEDRGLRRHPQAPTWSSTCPSPSITAWPRSRWASRT